MMMMMMVRVTIIIITTTTINIIIVSRRRRHHCRRRRRHHRHHHHHHGFIVKFYPFFLLNFTLFWFFTLDTEFCDSYTLLLPWALNFATASHIGHSTLRQLHIFTTLDTEPHWTLDFATVIHFYHRGP